MASVKPEYSRGSVDKAGRTYVDPKTSAEDREMALAIINNWRSSHSYPLNALQVSLRKLAPKIDNDPTVAQRIKRLPSIRHKLERFGDMRLSQMQDIGGCRAVLSSVEAVDEMVNYYRTKSRAKHALVGENPYILKPKSSGYRGVHLIYSYNGRPDWNGLKIEIQIRSRLQHAWATAVETVGTFTRQALKSSMGEEEWLQFFALMSSALALREGTPPVPGTPDDAETLTKELRRYVKRLKVIDRLQAYGRTLQHVERTMEGVKGGHTFLLELDVDTQRLVVWDFESTVQAAEQYEAVERAIEDEPNKDAVLVSVESLAALRRAYPNYFLDTTAFVASVKAAI
jgi:Region found in RelA / SpoT proteins